MATCASPGLVGATRSGYEQVCFSGCAGVSVCSKPVGVLEVKVSYLLH
jgi:hypothetical protein